MKGLKFGDTMTEAFKRATLIYGGYSLGGEYTTITVQFESHEDYKVISNGLELFDTLEDKYREKVIEIFNLGEINDFVSFYFVYPVNKVMFVHVTTPEIFYKICSESDRFTLKQNEEFLGDLGKGVYLANIESMDAIMNLCRCFQEDIDNDNELVIVSGYYDNYNEDKMFMCKDDNHDGYLVHRGDLVLPEFDATFTKDLNGTLIGLYNKAWNEE